MGDPVTINIRHLSRGLGVQLGQVQAVLELLDEGNTVPFITRYRKDQTGGLDEEKIRQIQDRLEKTRLLSERKQTILRSIESQGKLTEELDKRIRSANTAKRLEDLYLPYKPKKQTLAQLARSRGLETLADEIADRSPNCSDLDRRAADFASAERGVPTPADALLGAGHILAERISENVELRQRLREIIQRTGRIVSCRVGSDESSAESRPSERASRPSPSSRPSKRDKAPSIEVASADQASTETTEKPTAADSVAEPTRDEPSSEPAAKGSPNVEPVASSSSGEGASPTRMSDTVVEEPAEKADESPAGDSASDLSDGAASPPESDQPGSGMGGGPDGSKEDEASQLREGKLSPTGESVREEQSSAAAEAPAPPHDSTVGDVASEPATFEPSSGPQVSEPETETPVSEPRSETQESEAPSEPTVSEMAPGGETPAKTATVSDSEKAGGSQIPSPPKPKRKSSRKSNTERKAERKRQKKQKAEEKKQKAFSDYFSYREELRKIPPHRVLAINRGERSKVLRVGIECDEEAMVKVVDELSVPENHPHADFLRGCGRDALARLVMPSLEREARRELTERAEVHAVGVFAKNLRNLLLQPPVRDRRVLAVDPGFKSGCKLVALDQFGNVLAQAVIYLIGKPQCKEEAKSTIKELMERFKLTVVAIGNGTACREVEDFVGEIFNEAPPGCDWAYVIVNEAGASVYSTSSLGREEFPEYDATVRGAISIGRRLQDPLSELVKIDPANIGVGLYQHDVKAKHLRESLDDVVSSCVNYVGVDVNTASPALLRYVSGLNQLTARRVYEHRMQNGPFRDREQLRDVAGFGEATFVQSAGFLKIAQGDNPLDSSWIHPESYEVAGRVLERLGCRVDDLRNRETLAALAEKVSEVDASTLAEELAVGALLLKDILAQLVRPGRDPREDLPPPIFRHGVLKLEDLTPGMELNGTVLNVVDFGVFVDIGMHDSGLVHVSQLADKFVRDPHEVAAVGDIVKVWVLDVDKARRRVSLTMIAPGTPRASAGRSERSGQRGEASRGEREKQGEKRRERRGGRERSEASRGQRRGRDGRGRGRGGGPTYKPKSRPKPVTPITDGMREGREPMRSFSDLAQFFGTASGEPEASKKTKKRKGDPPKPEKEKEPEKSSTAPTDEPLRGDGPEQPPLQAHPETSEGQVSDVPTEPPVVDDPADERTSDETQNSGE